MARKKKKKKKNSTTFCDGTEQNRTRGPRLVHNKRTTFFLTQLIDTDAKISSQSCGWTTLPLVPSIS